MNGNSVGEDANERLAIKQSSERRMLAFVISCSSVNDR